MLFPYIDVRRFNQKYYFVILDLKLSKQIDAQLLLHSFFFWSGMEVLKVINVTFPDFTRLPYVNLTLIKEFSWAPYTYN